MADRVLLGLLPSSERAYGAAVCALKPATGGCVCQIHNYDNFVILIALKLSAYVFRIYMYV